MKAIMGFGFFLLFLAGIALVLLQGREMARQNMPAGGIGITGKSWRPAVLGGEQLPVDSGLYVSFAVDGSISGNGGCNNFFGSLEKSDNGLSVGQLGATRMACAKGIMQREQAFLQALQDSTRFESGENRLQLLNSRDHLLAELVLIN
jgi:heat shock protein HslJ